MLHNFTIHIYINIYIQDHISIGQFGITPHRTLQDYLAMDHIITG